MRMNHLLLSKCDFPPLINGFEHWEDEKAELSSGQSPAEEFCFLYFYIVAAQLTGRKMTESFSQKITPLILHLLQGDVTFFSSLKFFFFQSICIIMMLILNTWPRKSISNKLKTVFQNSPPPPHHHDNKGQGANRKDEHKSL